MEETEICAEYLNQLFWSRTKSMLEIYIFTIRVCALNENINNLLFANIWKMAA